MLKGEKECFDRLQNLNSEDKVAWFHCASLGEFEQGRPLIEEVKKAIKNEYKMDSTYTERYKKINEFNDNLNGERLIKALIDENVLKVTSK